MPNPPTSRRRNAFVEATLNAELQDSYHYLGSILASTNHPAACSGEDYTFAELTQTLAGRTRIYVDTVNRVLRVWDLADQLGINPLWRRPYFDSPVSGCAIDPLNPNSEAEMLATTALLFGELKALGAEMNVNPYTMSFE